VDLRFSIWQKPNTFQVDARKRCFQKIIDDHFGGVGRQRAKYY